MKKTIFALAFMAILFSSCVKEENPKGVDTPTPGQVASEEIFICSAEGVKTSLGPNDEGKLLKVMWSEDDAISINGVRYKLVEGQGTTLAKFKKDDTKGTPTAPFNAFYPAEGATWDATSGKYSLTIPANPVKYSSDDISYLPMYAYSNDVNLSFKNIISVLRVYEKNGADVTGTITVTSTQPICGDASIGGEGAALEFNGEGKKISVNIDGDNEAYVAVPAVTDATIGIAFGTDQEIFVKEHKNISLAANVINKTALPTKESSLHQGVKLYDGSTYWATTNMGASTPEEIGWYLAWAAPEVVNYTRNGDTFTFPQYGPESYHNDKWHSGGIASRSFIQYCAPYYDFDKYVYIKYTANGELLDAEDDIATVQWRGGWQIPSPDDYKTLLSNCYIVESYEKGITVYKAKAESDKGHWCHFYGYAGSSRSYYKYVNNALELDGSFSPSADYSPEDAHIYIPSGGDVPGSTLTNKTIGYYWTNTYNGGNSSSSVAYFFTFFNNKPINTVNITRATGINVRAVYK